MSKNQAITYLGRVLDQKKQAPISRAKVSLMYDGNAIITYTDLEGIYRLTVNFHNSDSLQVQLSIQANGYKSYNSSVKLSPKQKDLGDVRLVEPNSNLSSSSNISLNSSVRLQSQPESFIPLPIIIAVMVALFIMMAIAFRPSPQKGPVNRRNAVTNIDKISDFISGYFVCKLYKNVVFFPSVSSFYYFRPQMHTDTHR